MERLSDAAIAEALRQLPCWLLSNTGDAIARRWRVADFAAAFALVGRIAALAEAANHHPDITFGYGHVSATLSTRDAGGLTRLDMTLAGRIDRDTDGGEQ